MPRKTVFEPYQRLEAYTASDSIASGYHHHLIHGCGADSKRLNASGESIFYSHHKNIHIRLVHVHRIYYMYILKASVHLTHNVLPQYHLIPISFQSTLELWNLGI